MGVYVCKSLTPSRSPVRLRNGDLGREISKELGIHSIDNWIRQLHGR
jgi:hypothetical protein